MGEIKGSAPAVFGIFREIDIEDAVEITLGDIVDERLAYDFDIFDLYFTQMILLLFEPFG